MAETRTLEFADRGGITVAVTVTAPRERDLRLGAIRSAMINNAHLYPVNEAASEGYPTAGDRRTSYWLLALGGMAMPAIALGLFAAFLWAMGEDHPPIADEVRKTFLWAFMPVAMVLCTLLFLSFEWKARRFARKAQRVVAERTTATA